MIALNSVFLEYKAEFYRLRYEFFKLAPEPDGPCLAPELCSKSQYMCENCKRWAEWEIKGACYKRLAENPDNDTSLPVDAVENIMALNCIEFNRTHAMPDIETVIRQQFNLALQQARKINSGTLILRDPLRNVAGKYYSKDLFAYWRRCLIVYSLRMDGHGWEDIGCDIGKISSKKTDKVLPKGTVTRDVRNDFAEATRLITNAVGGSFPEDPVK